MRAAANPKYRRVWWPMFSQGGKTSAVFGVLGHHFDDHPAPALYVGPTMMNVKDMIVPRLDDMIRSTPSLWAKTARGKRFTHFRKEIAGMPLRLAWPSPSQLATGEYALVAIDEVDRIPRAIGKEGSAIEISDARTSTYPQSTTFGVSSPTEGTIGTYVHKLTGLEHWAYSDPEHLGSQIWALWQEGTRHEAAIPCPHCREYFVMRDARVTWPGRGGRNEATPEEIRTSARIVCFDCSAEIDNDSMPWCKARQVYVAPGQRPLAWQEGDDCAHVCDYTEDPELDPRRGAECVHPVEFGDFWDSSDLEDASFWCSGYLNFSPKKTIGAIAARLARAIRSMDVERIKGVMNTECGECYNVAGDAPELVDVKDRRSTYDRGQVDPEAVFLSCGVDVGAVELHFAVRAWSWSGLHPVSWLVEEGIAWGDTLDESETGPWSELAAVLGRRYGDRQIEAMGIDIGFRKDPVGRFVLAHRARGVIATRGLASIDGPDHRPRLWQINAKGTRRKHGLKVWEFDTDRMKLWLQARVRGIDPDPLWFLPRDVSEEYCAHLCAEGREEITGKWIKSGPNHWLDCEAINYLIARKSERLIKRRTRRIARERASAEADRMAATVSRADEPRESTPTERSTARRSTDPLRRRRRGSFATNWRG